MQSLPNRDSAVGQIQGVAGDYRMVTGAAGDIPSSPFTINYQVLLSSYLITRLIFLFGPFQFYV